MQGNFLDFLKAQKQPSKNIITITSAINAELKTLINDAKNADNISPDTKAKLQAVTNELEYLLYTVSDNISFNNVEYEMSILNNVKPLKETGDPAMIPLVNLLEKLYQDATQQQSQGFCI